MTAMQEAPSRRKLVSRPTRFTQEQIVLVLALALFALFAVTLEGFATTANVKALVRSVSILGILGLGMAVTVIGRGIDLSVVAIMAISVAWALALVNQGRPVASAFLMGFLFAVAIGLLNGLLVAYVQIPALFTTLAMGVFVAGFGRFYLVSLDVVYVPDDIGPILALGQGSVAGVPLPIVLFAALAVVIHLVLKRTTFGHYVYTIGDNSEAARITGAPVRPTILGQYVVAAAMAYLAGIVLAMSAASMNTRLVTSTFIYDVILVVVLGGIGLSGGKGGARNVVVGTLLIGVLLNGMTIMNVQFTMQNLVKSVVLLAAIVLDTMLNPRDEQTAQQGDI